MTANDGFALDSVTVTMDGVDITSTVYVNGVITIAEVTGDIVITAVATKSGYTNILDTIGYYDGYRISISSGENSACADRVATGYIPFYGGTTVRVKGMTYPTSQVGTYTYAIYNIDTKALLSGGYLYQGVPAINGMTFEIDGDLLTITRKASAGDVYIRISGGATTGADCIVTVNEEIT